MNISPPWGPSPVIAGMSPERISDAHQRAIYEAAIAQNRKKAETYLTQATLKRITPKFIAELEHYFVESFGSAQIGPIVGLFSTIHNPEKERIIKRIAEMPK